MKNAATERKENVAKVRLHKLVLNFEGPLRKRREAGTKKKGRKGQEWAVTVLFQENQGMRRASSDLCEDSGTEANVRRSQTLRRLLILVLAAVSVTTFCGCMVNLPNKRVTEWGRTPVFNKDGTRIAYVVEVDESTKKLFTPLIAHPDYSSSKHRGWWEIRETDLATGETTVLVKGHGYHPMIDYASSIEDTFTVRRGRRQVAYRFGSGKECPNPEVPPRKQVTIQGQRYVFEPNLGAYGQWRDVWYRWRQIEPPPGDWMRLLHRDAGVMPGGALVYGASDQAMRRFVFHHRGDKARGTNSIADGGDIWLGDITDTTLKLSGVHGERIWRWFHLLTFV